MTVYLQLLKVFGRNFEARTFKTKLLEKISRWFGAGNDLQDSYFERDSCPFFVKCFVGAGSAREKNEVSTAWE